MSLIHAINLSVFFSGKNLFHQIGFQVEPGDRIALVGPNGSGKTTILRLIAGEILPDDGEIRINSSARIGYLPQDVQETPKASLLRSIINEAPGRKKLREEISVLEQKLHGAPSKVKENEISVRLAEMHHKMGELDKQFPAHGAEKILSGLGFSEDDFEKPVDTLSGGWKMRAALGALLFQDPDILLMDEPTNHLDLPSVRWLETFLQDFKGAIILICHDRDFLNRQSRSILSFEPEGFRAYKGNYDYYLSAREEGKKTLEAKARNQEQKVKEAKKFIERFRAKATKARQAQSKIKLLKKMELIRTHKSRKSIRFSFPDIARSGKDVITLQGISKAFWGVPLYENIDLMVMKGERVAIVGPNGSGKTTLLKMVAGEMEPDRGHISLGHGVTMSYYAQHHSEMLDSRKTIIEEVYQAVPHESVSFVRGVCGAFLFSGEDVDKPIGVLSGGEKARVSLAKILVNPGNLLVMDEPTNHLDIISSEILEDAMADYNGTLVFVSHNQAFINRLATKIWDIREGTIIEYPGTLYDYLDHLDREKKRARSGVDDANGNEQEVQNGSDRQKLNRKEERKKNAERRQLISSTLKPYEKKLANLEERISEMEIREKELETLLADPPIFSDKDKSVPLLNEYGILKRKIEEMMGRWEHIQQKLEGVKKDLGEE